MPELNTVTGSDLHYPRGTVGATANQVFVSDGANGGSFKTAHGHGSEIYFDVATTGSPVAMTVADTPYGIPNDGVGSGTDVTYKLPSATNMWNTSTGQFEFATAGAVLGDTVDFEIDIDIVNSAVNGDFIVSMELAIGGASPITHQVAQDIYKAAGTYTASHSFSLLISTADILNFPARFVVQSDSTGDTFISNHIVLRHVLANTRYV